MAVEKKDTVMNIVSWKTREEICFSIYSASGLLLWRLGLQNPIFRGFFDVFGSNRIK
ncbi:hypothetical protein RHMOL_Rhmol04G0142800 [Rhododendron molle]|nr:hypothetical protein RHMOL_Rhmol04G0142800 [Rhododendron molle]